MPIPFKTDLRPLANRLAAPVSLLGLLAGVADGKQVSFNRDIRPILADNCFACHGPDAKKREASLRLDTFDGATADLGGHAAVVPGDPEASELLTRVTAHDLDEVMPPPETKKGKLAPDQVETLRHWIAAGAPYEKHWAFVPVSKRDPPPSDGRWAKGEIDRFIEARLRREGLSPSAGK